MNEHKSAQPCGCDPGLGVLGYLCERHTKEAEDANMALLRDSQSHDVHRRPAVGGVIASGPPPFISGLSVSQPRLDRGEVRVVDPTTGGEKGTKLARFSLIPSDWLWALAEHYGIGARKYDDNNWRKGYKWSLSLDASERHLRQWLMGEDDDKETGSNHLIAAAWHLIALWWFQKHAKGTDDIRHEGLTKPQSVLEHYQQYIKTKDGRETNTTEPRPDSPVVETMKHIYGRSITEDILADQEFTPPEVWR